MKTSIFEPTLFKKNVKRFMPLWLAYFFIWILILSGVIIKAATTEPRVTDSMMSLTELIRQISQGGSGFISFVFMMLSAYFVFSFMYSENSVTFINSLPLKRENVFLSSVASGIIPIIIANIFIFLLMLLLSLSLELKISGFLLRWFEIASLISLGYYGLAVLCCNVSGNAPASIILYLIFNFLAAVIYISFNGVAEIFLFGYEAVELSETAIIKFSPPAALVIELLFGIESGGVFAETYSIHFALVGLAFIFISFFLFKNRSMETAGEFISQRGLRPAFKVCMGLVSALVLGIILYYIFFGNLKGDKSFIPFMLCSLVSAAIGYFVGEALIEKKLDVFKNKKSNLMFLCVSIITVAFVMILRFDVFGYEKNVPDSDEIQSFSIGVRGVELNNCENKEIINEAVALHRIFTESKADSIEKDDLRSFFIDISYKLKDGSKLSRSYRFFCDPSGSRDDLPEALKAAERFINTKPVVLERLKIEFENIRERDSYAAMDFDFPMLEETKEQPELYSKDFSLKLFRDFYENAVMKDAANGNIGHRSIVADEKAMENFYNCSVSFYYEKDEKTGRYNWRLEFIDTNPPQA